MSKFKVELFLKSSGDVTEEQLKGVLCRHIDDLVIYDENDDEIYIDLDSYWETTTVTEIS